MPNKSLRMFLEKLGFNLQDPNFVETPERMARAYQSMCLSEEDTNSTIELNLKKSFPTKYQGIILYPRIKAHSVCPHHMLPIEYEIIVAYIPQQIQMGSLPTKVLGLSKVVRIVKSLSKRAVLQEDLTYEIAEVFEKIEASGVAVVTKAWHGCMTCRGVLTEDPVVMSEMRGGFKDIQSTREEFFHLVRYGREPR
jgi:GTP cyclohydrolase IA